jgi:rubrerythrin
MPRRVDLSCTECGYGVVVAQAPERCPMCGGAAWAAPQRRRAVW